MVEHSNPHGMDAVFKEIEQGKLTLNMTDRLIEKHGVPIPAPPPTPIEDLSPASSATDGTEAA